ncbi:MAG: MmgE/PrpD family protein [Paracoccaceae bacterium]
MNLSSSITGRMATRLVDGAFNEAELSGALYAKASLCLVDFFSGAYEAAPLDWSRQAAAIAEPLANGAALISGKVLTVPGDAAFANAVAAHGLVREDMHTESISHLGVVVWPALLAVLSQADKPVSGRAFLAAAIAGYEVGGRIGAALMNAELARLFRPTGIAGPFASAAACGLIKGLDALQMRSALGIAANTTAGFNEWPHSGGSEMYFHAGFAARNGIAAAQLAEQGAFAAPGILEGEAGLFRSVGRVAAPDDIALFPAGDYVIASVFHKQAPACNFAQTPCQAALQAAQKFNGPVGDIAAIKVRITDAARLYPGCDHTGPFQTVLQAKMSIQYSVAAAILSREIAEANYARIGQADIERLIGLITLVVDADYTAAFPARQGASVEIETRNGTVFEADLEDIIKAGPEEIQQRLEGSAADWLGAEQATRLTNFISQILTCEDVRPINGLCIPPN